jgi:subtilisin family serine protease
MRILTATNPMTATDVRDHGLFVAGLIHAVAPDSDIRLIRVLNEYGCGDLFTLNKALYRFIAEMEAERGTLDGTVINLSLGVLKPALEDAESMEQETITIDPSLEVLAEDTVESLRAAVLLAHSQGAVVVAAAGNDSYVEGKPLPPQLPAEYPFVIGVAGSNVYRDRACFSNWGDVSAPSGDARSDEMPGPCEPKAIECSGDCAEAVISLVRSPDMDYAYWRGTSFSAPLASGLAALVLDAGASRCICGSRWVHPNEVFEAIRCGASLGDGVINVPATLFRCIP